MSYFFSSRSYNPGKWLAIRLPKGSMQHPFLPPQLALLGSPQLTSTSPPSASQTRALSLPTQPLSSPRALQWGQQSPALAEQSSWGFIQRVCCPDCGLFMDSYIKSARSPAKSSLSQGKLHLYHLIRSWFTHTKQNTCRSFPFSTSPKGSRLAHLNQDSLQQL